MFIQNDLEKQCSHSGC